MPSHSGYGQESLYAITLCLSPPAGTGSQPKWRVGQRLPLTRVSGSGAAVAANLCAAAIGTETDGSIICPAQTNGIVGIKPALGLISRSRIIPIAHSQDTAGPMARSVADAAILPGALTGVDAGDAATRLSKKKAWKEYRAYLDKNGLQGALIGVARNMAGTDARVIKIFKAGLNRYLAACWPKAHVRTLEDVIKFNEEHKGSVKPYFGQEHMRSAKKKGPLTSKQYLRALERNHRLTRREGIRAAMTKHRLDALIVPSGGPAWMIDLVNGDATNWDMESTSMAAAAGYPHITVPAGYIFGLPVGLSFRAKAWQEATLIKLAYAFELATKIRKPPKFLTSADLSG